MAQLLQQKCMQQAVSSTAHSPCLGHLRTVHRANDFNRRALHRLQISKASAIHTGSELSGAHDELESSWKTLIDFTKNDCLPNRAGVSAEQRELLEQSLLMVNQHPYQAEGWNPAAEPSTLIISVLSGNIRMALAAMRNFTSALGVDWVEPDVEVPGVERVSQIQGAVFLKFRVGARAASITELKGSSYRGVLLQIGLRNIGHLPLALFQNQRNSTSGLANTG